MNISELVSKTVATGIPPLELTYHAINNCGSRLPVAYKAEIGVNSIELGHIIQSEFSKVSDPCDVGIRVSEWGIKRALKEIHLFVESKRHPLWVSISCPAEYAVLPDAYERLKNLLSEVGDMGKIKLCLEFPDKLLSIKGDVRTFILDLKLLGIVSMVNCDVSGNCPFFRLTEIPVDNIILSSGMANYVDDRNKPEVLRSLVQYLHSVDVKAIVEGEYTSEQLRAFNRIDCLGYLPHSENDFTLEEALSQKEAD